MNGPPAMLPVVSDTISGTGHVKVSGALVKETFIEKPVGNLAMQDPVQFQLVSNSII